MNEHISDLTLIRIIDEASCVETSCMGIMSMWRNDISCRAIMVCDIYVRRSSRLSVYVPARSELTLTTVDERFQYPLRYLVVEERVQHDGHKASRYDG